MSKKNLLLAIIGVMILVFFSNCGSVKHTDMIMLKDVQNQLAAIETLPALTLQTDDMLSIQVSSQNPETVIAFQLIGQDNNNNNNNVSSDRVPGVLNGYRVDEEGNIYLPYLGQMRAAGKSIVELRKEISERLVQYFPDATVQIRYLNFRVTLMGEVNLPNTYVIPNERLNILEAIGMAGDFTPYARRNAVMIIRERNDVREFVRLNTQDTSLFKSPYFYLSPNDIVYVEPLKAKQYATQGDFFDRYSSALIPFVSLVTFIVGLAIR